MVMSVRHIELTNTTGAVVAVGGASTQIGQDYSGIAVKRTLAAIDIGTTAGKVREAAGMIFAEVYGGVVKDVISLTIFRAGVVFMAGGDGTTTVVAKPKYTVTNLNGVSTVRLIDTAAGVGILATGDVVVMVLAIGNS